ncbi:GNAT family N-acetyltransferase [Clostridiaceae bacterium M8S5]|nr:GNAT family N-acetyltransferase [Clostridiaceae bacterium M8S5]
MNVNVKLQKCTDKDIIMNLYPLYLHDLSHYNKEDVNEKGKYEYDEINLYWQKDNMHPLLIKVNDCIAGFVLLTERVYVRKGCDYCIQEFFVLRRYRKVGIGQKVFKELIKQFKGRYCLLVLKENVTALKFWTNNYKINDIKYEEGDFEKDNKAYYHEFCL